MEPDSLSQIVWWNKGKSLSQEEFERITDNQVQEMVHNEKKAAIQCFLNVIRLPEFEKDIREKFPGRQLAMKLMLLLEEYSARLSSCLDQNESELCVCIQLSILQCIAEWLWNRDPAEGGLLIFNRLLNFVHVSKHSPIIKSSSL